MIRLKRKCPEVQLPGLFNVYPTFNEVSFHSNKGALVKFAKEKKIVIDENYGRIFGKKTYEKAIPYGPTYRLKCYPCGTSGKVVDYLRVPYRKVAVFELESLSSLEIHLEKIRKANPAHEILARGQTKLYYLDRNKAETTRLYGDTEFKEPSFLPSHLRTDFNEMFLHSMWHSQASILLNDICYDKQLELSPDDFERFEKDVESIIKSFLFTPFALGIAQHYGLPSVGLDLTNNIRTAAWFALNRIIPTEGDFVQSVPTETPEESLIFIFRCPRNAVYPYKNVRPKGFPEGRPDRQDAWFCHVGWGYARNQLGSYLACAFRLSEKHQKEISDISIKHLFPNTEQDPILEYFLKMKAMEKYEGEAKRALQGVYTFDH